MAQSFRQSLRRCRVFLGWSALGVAVCGGFAGCGADPEPRRPNVVLITLESLRTDHVGALGGSSRTRSEIPLTPQLDAFAREAVSYPDAHSVTSWTLSSHASLFTGLYPTAHQTRLPLARLGDSYRTLAEMLAESGYQTAGVVSGPYLRRSHNLHQGFEEWDQQAASVTHGLGHADVTNPQMEETLSRFLTEGRDATRPFFLFAYFWDPHFDFIPPAPFDRMFVDDGAEPFDTTDFDTNEEIHAGMSGRRLAYLWSQYAGEIRATDALLGRLFDRMRAEGVWDDTVVIVTADHGEEFFDHGEKGHKKNLHAETVHVPLFIKWPKGFETPVAAGEHDPRLASLVDLVPTLLELAGVRSEEALPGRSLLAPADPQRAILYELLASEYVREANGEVRERLSVSSAVRSGRFKLIATRPPGAREFELELYDALADPRERFDRSEAEPAAVRDLGQRHEELRQAAEATAERHTAGGSAELGDEERAQLCALGYLDC